VTQEVREASAALVLPLLVLALGHMLSNAVRTLPAIAADVLARDLGVTADGLAALTGGYLFAFALGQVPLGVALDRWGVRPVSLTLFALVCAGALLAAVAPGPWSFLVAQTVMGIGCCGMLLCPMTFAARILTPARFGLWSGLIQAVGNMGMLLSASPLAWLVDAEGWRAGYLASACFGVVGMALVFATVRDVPPPRDPSRTLAGDARETLALAVSPALRGVVALTFASFAVVMGIRGLWGGPWLMEVKGLTRIEAGHVLLIATLSLIVGPAAAGILDRRLGHRRAVLAIGHLLAAGLIFLLLAAARLPASVDLALLVAFGLAVSVQPLVFALARGAVPVAQTGRALAAVNLSFFGGAAVLQAASGVAAAWGGIGAAIAVFAGAVVIATLLFLAMPGPRGQA
jgi:predicted MFS family arabinose efflux permease